MKNNIDKYFESLQALFGNIVATNANGNPCNFNYGIERAIAMIIECWILKSKLLFIGNGASAAISSHIATDFWKNAGIRALAFNDSSLLTCISNDFGYKHVFEKPIERFADPGDILFAISSSGESENIIRATKMAKKKGLKIITLSGFDKHNRLRKLGDINFYVPSHYYGFVEIVHMGICHCLVDISKK